MARFKLNAGRAEEAEKNAVDYSTPIDKGWYEAFITAVGFDKTDGGKEYLEVVFTIRDDVEQKFQKRKIWEKFFFTDKAMARLDQLLLKCGAVDGEEMTDDYIKETVMGKPIKIEVGQRTYQDKIYNNLTFMGMKDPEVGGRYVPEESKDGLNEVSNDGDDPFADNDNEGIDLSDDDLPF